MHSTEKVAAGSERVLRFARACLRMVTFAPRAAAAAAVCAMSNLARGRTRVVRGVVFGE